MLCEYHIYDPLAYKKVGFLINFFLKMMSVLKNTWFFVVENLELHSFDF